MTPNEPKRILLIGSNGQLGQALLDQEPKNFKILGLQRKDLDITHRDEVKEILKISHPDILINTTAYNLVSLAESKKNEAMLINCKAVSYMAKVCREMDIKFVTFSTDYVFDGLKTSPYKEHDKPNPLQVYGKSKLLGEREVLKNNKKAFIIRTSSLYGGQGSPDKGNFVLNILKEAKGKKNLEVSSDQTMSPTYAGDLAQATLKLLSKKIKPGIYHLVNEGYCTWAEFSEEIFKLANIETKVKPVDRAGFAGGVRRPMFSVLKNTKARKSGIILPSWQAGLKRYLDYLKLYEK